MLEGWARLVGKTKGTLCHYVNTISGVLLTLCSSQFESTLFRATFLLAFSRQFRVGELVVRSRVTFSSQALDMGP